MHHLESDSELDQQLADLSPEVVLLENMGTPMKALCVREWVIHAIKEGVSKKAIELGKVNQLVWSVIYDWLEVEAMTAGVIEQVQEEEQPIIRKLEGDQMAIVETGKKLKERILEEIILPQIARYKCPA